MRYTLKYIKLSIFLRSKSSMFRSYADNKNIYISSQKGWKASHEYRGLSVMQENNEIIITFKGIFHVEETGKNNEVGAWWRNSIIAYEIWGCPGTYGIQWLIARKARKATISNHNSSYNGNIYELWLLQFKPEPQISNLHVFIET